MPWYAGYGGFGCHMGQMAAMALTQEPICEIELAGPKMATTAYRPSVKLGKMRELRSLSLTPVIHQKLST